MINTAYQSTVASKTFRIDADKPLRIAKIRGGLIPITTPGYDNIYLVIASDLTAEIPTFNQPYVLPGTVGKPWGDKDSFIAIDLRGRSNRVIVDGELRMPTAGTEWVMIKQAILQKLWLGGTRDELYLMSDLPVKAYSRWIAQRVSGNLTLEPLYAQYLEIAAAWWYICQHHTPLELGEDEWLSKSQYISRLLMVPAEDAYDIISACGYISNMFDFVNKSKLAIKSHRYNQITASVLTSALAGSWFNAKETAGVAIEFPPTFLALLHSAVNERGYRDTPISKIVERLNQGNMHRQFNIAFNGLVFPAGV